MYAYPPITEAVIEVRLAEAVDSRLIERVSDALGEKYPGLQIHDAHEFQFDAEVVPRVSSKMVGHIFRRASDDQTEIAMISPTNFVVSQLPDYPGWETFIARFQRDWGTWKKIVGVQRVARIGVRYVNRLDIPMDARVLEESQYLNIFVNTPPELGAATTYALQISLPCPSIDGTILVNSGVVPAPLEGHASILLDIDVSTERSIPMKDSELFSLLTKFREEKIEYLKPALLKN